MSERRIIIGCFIAVLVLIVVSLIGNNTWNTLEANLLGAQSKLGTFKKSSDSSFAVVSFKKNDTVNLLEDKDTEEQKNIIMTLVEELANKEVNSINLLLGKNDPLELESLDLEMSLGDHDISTQTLNTSDIELFWKNSKDQTRLLDQRTRKLNTVSASDVLLDTVDAAELQGQNIILASPFSRSSGREINLIINYIEDLSIANITIPKFIFFILVMAAGVLLTAMVYWARIAVFLVSTVVCLVLSQIAYSIFGLHLEIISLLGSLLGVVLISNIFDLSYVKEKKQIFAEAVPEINTSKSQIQISNSAVENELVYREKIAQDFRQRYYQNIEKTYENLALNFEEETVHNIEAINEKLAEVLDNKSLEEEDRIKVSLLRHNFDQLVEKLDATLFKLVPFRFEAEQGFITLMELLASKIFAVSKGRVRINIESDSAQIKLEKQELTHSFRIIQELFELILKENNPVFKEDILEIKLKINLSINEKTQFRISYQGNSIKDNDKFKPELEELFKRTETIDKAELEIGELGLEQVITYRLPALSLL